MSPSHTLLGLLSTVSLTLLASGSEPSEGTLTADDGAGLWYRLHDPGVASDATPLIVPNAVYLEEAFRDLSTDRPVLFYDLRNRGRSESLEPDDERLDGGVHRDVADLEAVRRHFAWERVQVLGHSYVGAVVGLWSLEHSEAADRVVMIGPIGPRPSEHPQNAEDPLLREVATELGGWRERAQAGPSADLCREYWETMARVLINDPERQHLAVEPAACELGNEWPPRMEAQIARIWPSLLALGIQPDRLQRSTTPTLVVHGTADRNAPLLGAKDWAEGLGAGRLLEIEGAGHLPWIESDRVIPAVRRFLAGEGQTSRR